MTGMMFPTIFKSPNKEGETPEKLKGGENSASKVHRTVP